MSADKEETIKDGVDESHEAHFEPLVKLDEVDVKSGEEEEEELLKLRAKLYRFDKEWKERGTGDVKFLKHKVSGRVRVLMRRDKTLKVCMNQIVNSETELAANAGSDRAWQWKCIDFADKEEGNAEVLCIKLRNVDDAKSFKDTYEECKAKLIKEEEEEEKKEEEEEEKEEEKKEEEKVEEKKE
mmetsp:Transcript_38832/g.99668  ORF Transcript_38832/g.99668 Transcript_38832/m.99668 type:complete len:184 (-) Transcript_38832:371-922(-)